MPCEEEMTRCAVLSAFAALTLTRRGLGPQPCPYAAAAAAERDIKPASGGACAAAAASDDVATTISATDFQRLIHGVLSFAARVRVPMPVLGVTALYLRRLREAGFVCHSLHGALRLFIAAVVIAYKFVVEGRVKNSRFLPHLPGVTLADLNHMEMAMLKLLDYRLFISPVELNHLFANVELQLEKLGPEARGRYVAAYNRAATVRAATATGAVVARATAGAGAGAGASGAGKRGKRGAVATGDDVAPTRRRFTAAPPLVPSTAAPPPRPASATVIDLLTPPPGPSSSVLPMSVDQTVASPVSARTYSSAPFPPSSAEITIASPPIGPVASTSTAAARGPFVVHLEEGPGVFDAAFSVSTSTCMATSAAAAPASRPGLRVEISPPPVAAAVPMLGTKRRREEEEGLPVELVHAKELAVADTSAVPAAKRQRVSRPRGGPADGGGPLLSVRV